MNNKDTFHDELTAHLACQSAPLPYPKRFDHGYVRRDMFLPEPTKPITIDPPIEAIRMTGCWLEKIDPGKIKLTVVGTDEPKHPGPITMHEPVSHVFRWVVAVLGAAGLLCAGVALWVAVNA